MSEFRIIDCKITTNISNKLVNLITQGCTLQQLAIVNCNLSERSVQAIAEFTHTSKLIREIDLSWCKTQRSTWTNFFELICNTRNLSSLSLVGNLLIEPGKDTLANIVSFIKKSIKL